MGCLITYAIIDACIMQMRFSDILPAVVDKMGSKTKKTMTAAPWCFIFFSFLHATAISCEWGTGCNIAFGAMVFINYLVLQVLFCKYPSE